jgi:hypothetical protein
MNKKYNYLLAALFLFVFQSCLFEEKDIFDKSAAERLTQSVKDNLTLLQSAPNGWVMQYFPDVDHAGYPMIVKFGTDGFASVMGRNTTTGNKDSLAIGAYDVKVDESIVLTFDGYNPVIHKFADPTVIVQSGQVPGYGYKGDFEFTIMSATSDKIRLKGKKRGLDIYLLRLNENQNWSEYFNMLDNMDAMLFNKDIPISLLLTIGNESYSLANGASHIFTATKKTTDGEMLSSSKMPFIITPTGLRFYQPIDIDGVKIETFQLNSDKTALVCSDEGADAKIVGPQPIDAYFEILKSGSNWSFGSSAESMELSLKSAYDRIVNSLAVPGRKLDILAFIDNKTYGTSLLIQSSKNGTKATGYIGFSMKLNDNSQLVLTFNGFDSKSNSTGKSYYDQYDGVAAFVSLLEGTYTLQLEGATLNPQTIRLVNMADNTKWFNLFAK